MNARSAPHRIRATRLASHFAWLGLGCALACSTANDGGLTSTGGAPSTGGVGTTGGTASSTGGTSAPTGGSSTGGTPTATGGVPQSSTGGSAALTGGNPGTGGSSGGSQTGGTNTGGTNTGGASGGVTSGGAGGAQAGKGGGTSAGSGGTEGKSGAGGGGMAATGGAGGTTDFRPCPSNGDPCKILPLGDSITWGIQYDGAYRVELFTKAVAASQKITFTGSLSNGPAMVSGVTFPKSNEGHSGWTIDQDAGLVPSPAFNTIPHIVLLMIGTNDVYAASGQATMPMRLGSLLDKIIAAAPNALLVVAKITPLANGGSASTIKTYNDAIPGLVQTRASAGKHVIMVDMNTGFTSGMLSSDGVHPNKSGYDYMGDVWYAAISSLLPK